MNNFPYTFQDLSCANDILGMLDLYPSSFHLWASKVKAWYKAFYALVAKYRKTGLSQALAIKGVFNTLRERPQSTIFSLFNSFASDCERAKRKAIEKSKELRRQKAAANATRFPNFSVPSANGDGNDNEQSIKSRASKWNKRTNVMKKTGFWYAFSE